MMHQLKTWPVCFEALADGSKTFEIRHNDRDFKTGDTIVAREWDFNAERYTGRELRYRVGFVATGALFGLDLGEHAVLSLVPDEDALPPQVTALMDLLQRMYVEARAEMESAVDDDPGGDRRHKVLACQRVLDLFASTCGMDPPDWAELGGRAYRRGRGLNERPVPPLVAPLVPVVASAEDSLRVISRAELNRALRDQGRPMPHRRRNRLWDRGEDQ